MSNVWHPLFKETRSLRQIKPGILEQSGLDSKVPKTHHKNLPVFLRSLRTNSHLIQQEFSGLDETEEAGCGTLRVCRSSRTVSSSFADRFVFCFSVCWWQKQLQCQHDKGSPWPSDGYHCFEIMPGKVGYLTSWSSFWWNWHAQPLHTRNMWHVSFLWRGGPSTT